MTLRVRSGFEQPVHLSDIQRLWRRFEEGTSAQDRIHVLGPCNAADGCFMTDSVRLAISLRSLSVDHSLHLTARGSFDRNAFG